MKMQEKHWWGVGGAAVGLVLGLAFYIYMTRPSAIIAATEAGL